MYEVSSSGIVRSVPRDYGAGVIDRPRILSISANKQGYLRCTLSKDGKKSYHFIHRIVASAFIPNPQAKPCVNHIDRDVTNNHVTNLEWVTHSENTHHGICRELISRAVSREIEQIDANTGELIKRWPSLKAASEGTGIAQSSISEVTNGHKKTCRGYIWKKVRSNGHHME